MKKFNTMNQSDFKANFKTRQRMGRIDEEAGVVVSGFELQVYYLAIF